MALTKEVVTDKTEIVGEFKAVHCREATIIKEDGVVIGRAYSRHVLHPTNSLLMKKNEDGSFTHNDTDISGEPQETQDVCNVVWTDAVKAAWKTFLEEKHDGPPGS